MIEVVSIYEEFSKDTAFVAQNGSFSIPTFNRFSRRAELRLIDWLKGDPAGNIPPEPWATQVLKDFLSPLIEVKSGNVSSEGFFDRPSDYYRWDNFFRIGSKVESDCEEEQDPDDSRVPIVILDGDAFNNRINTWIPGDKPTMKNPIAKLVGRKIETYPKDLGPVTLEYIRLPKFAEVKKEIDPDYNTDVAVKVTDYEWDEWAREPLIWFITDLYANRTSNKSMKEFNIATKKTVRE